MPLESDATWNDARWQGGCCGGRYDGVDGRSAGTQRAWVRPEAGRQRGRDRVLRHQLSVLRRQVARPPGTPRRIGCCRLPWLGCCRASGGPVFLVTRSTCWAGIVNWWPAGGPTRTHRTRPPPLDEQVIDRVVRLPRENRAGDMSDRERVPPPRRAGRSIRGSSRDTVLVNGSVSVEPASTRQAGRFLLFC